jgi:hypothetical protein
MQFFILSKIKKGVCAPFYSFNIDYKQILLLPYLEELALLEC